MVKSYLEDNLFTVRTDHSAQNWILNLAYFTGILSIWRIRLTKFDFEVFHLVCIVHQASYALSILPTSAADTAKIEEDILALSDDDKPPLITIACFECDVSSSPITRPQSYSPDKC